ncbi:MAG: aldehyde dehydrogenase family protein, partial [Gammaproteobacteria bacterium]
MESCLKFYINGEWVDPSDPKPLDVINPATEEVIGQIMLGNAADVDKAVAAAKAAFESFSRTSVAERVELLEAIQAAYKERYNEMVETISAEMGAPVWLCKAAQAAMGPAHLGTTIEVLKNYKFEEERGTITLRREPIGVCGFITPWNWPINQIACKVIPALAAGCTMVLKPSEVAPLNAAIFAEVLDKAGVPKGVFNLVNGDGPSVGDAMSRHP